MLWKLFCLVSCLLLCGLVACGEVEIRDPACETCPERCLEQDGKRRCVTCLNDGHCQTATSPTSRCSADNKCVCGSNQDCPVDAHCGADGRCLECLDDSHCKNPQFPICGEGQCRQCKAGDTRACAPRGVKTCGKGTQTCNTEGRWGNCEGLTGKICRDDQLCLGDGCGCPTGYKECAGRCVDLENDAGHCGACNKACPDGARCAGRECVKSCPPETPTACKHSCVNLQRDNQHCGTCNTKCAPGEQCTNGVCSCPPGLIRCNGACINPKHNPEHCGRCNNTCLDGKVCADGSCTNTCPISTPTHCFGGCMDASNNATHCGSCNQRCQPDQRCTKGTCQCPPGQTQCAGKCISTKTHPGHCGGCNNRCQSGEVCANGICQPTCPSATPTTCFGGCYDTQTSPYHCGGCGKTCLPGQVCQGGQCACPLPLQACNGICVDTRYHRLHCGACGNTCPKGQVCAEGSCQSACPNNASTICYGACVDLQTNSRHCGTCGTVCEPGQTCQSGQCKCKTGNDLCDGQCTDIQSNSQHCGACGKACPKGEACHKGQCTSACPPPTTERCGERCVDTKTDNQHCGACGTSCQSGLQCCNGSCVEQANVKPEECNGKDDDCDGGVDEDVPVQACYTGPSGTNNKGTCKGGTTQCTNGQWGPCVGQVVPSAPFCDGKDHDCDGKVETKCTWQFTLGSTSKEQITAIAVGPNGHTYAAGTFEGTLQIGPTSHKSQGKTDAFLGKWDTKGNLLWFVSFGASGADTPNALTVGQDGAIYLTGNFEQQFQLDNVQLKSNGGTDAFVLKFSTNGKAIWGFAAGGPSADEGHGVVVDSNGVLSIAGTFSGTATFGSKQATAGALARQVFVVQFASNGSVGWLLAGGSQFFDTCHTLVPGPGGQLYLGAGFDSPATFGGLTIKGPDLGYTVGTLVNISATGKVNWIKQATGETGAQIRHIVANPQGIWVAGTFEKQLTSFDGKVYNGKGLIDVFFSRLDSKGTHQWTQVAGGTRHDSLAGLFVDNQERAWFAANVSKQAQFGSNQPAFPGSTAIVVGALTKSGNFASLQTFGNTASHQAGSLNGTPQGVLILGGGFQQTLTINGQTQTSQGLLDIFLVRLQ